VRVYAKCGATLVQATQATLFYGVAFSTGMIVLLLGLLIVALAIFCYVIPLSRDPWYSTFQVGLLCLGLPVGLVGGALIVRGLTLPSDNPAAAYAAEVLARGLDYRYTFIRNISRFGLGYIDAVLVGPNGALVFYFVDRSGGFFFLLGARGVQHGGVF
jgi:hypothetical protein